MNYTYFSSPIGPLLLAADALGLRQIQFPVDGEAAPAPSQWQRNDTLFIQAAEQLEDYFGGRRHSFELALAPQVSAFQSEVLKQLGAIPFGQTRSYAELARVLNKPRAARAVGTACARNPLPVVIPCHRVIGSNGALTGFAGGLAAKQWLLAHEARANAARYNPG